MALWRTSIVMNRKTLSLLTAAVLLLSLLPLGTTTASASDPDYSYEMDLPADGSNDTDGVYKVERRDTGKSGYISIEAYMSDREVYVTLENVDKVTLYFNETDIDVEKYVGMLGGDIDIIIDNDGSTLAGEFHGVPDPEKAEVSTSWVDHSYSDGVFSFTGLETSTTTITLSFSPDALVNTVIDIVIFVWYMSFLIFILQFVYKALNGFFDDI